MSPVWNILLPVLTFLAVLAAAGFLIWFFGVRNKKNKNQMQDGAIEGKEYTFLKFGIHDTNYLWRR